MRSYFICPKEAAIASILILMILLVACGYSGKRSMDNTIAAGDRAELVRCQNQDAGWVDACRHVQQVKDSNVGTMGGQL